MIYFDHNATAPQRPEALSATVSAASRPGNPSSIHAQGQAARQSIEDAELDVCRLVGVSAKDWRVIFTSGGTEADALLLRGLIAKRMQQGTRRLLISALEHPAVIEAAEQAAAATTDNDGFAVEMLPVGSDGRVRLDANTIDASVVVVALMLANNETGVIQPVTELAALAALHGVPVHVDAVQAAGKLDLRAYLAEPAVVSVALSAHKFGGPRGVGALLLRRGIRGEVELWRPDPIWHGGGQQQGIRPGTPPTALICGMAAAARAATTALSDGAAATHRGMRDAMQASLLRISGSFAVATDAPRLPNTLALGFTGVPADRLVRELSARGVMVGAGAACHAGVVAPSRVLTSMAMDAGRALEVIRISLGWNSTKHEVDVALEVIETTVKDLRDAEGEQP